LSELLTKFNPRIKKGKILTDGKSRRGFAPACLKNHHRFQKLFLPLFIINHLIGYQFLLIFE